MSLLSGSIPPVSIIVNSLSSHVTSEEIRSLVTPGVSLTIEIISPASTLKRVDLPTFGLPTIATTGLLILTLLYISFYICHLTILLYITFVK